jgi:hypothetical protein
MNELLHVMSYFPMAGAVVMTVIAIINHWWPR